VALVTTTFINSTGKFHLHVESKFSTINALWGTCKCQALSLFFLFFGFIRWTNGKCQTRAMAEFVKKNASTNQTELL